MSLGATRTRPAIYAKGLKTAPWSVGIEGEVAKAAIWHLEDILKGRSLEERIYRHRCVEGWSMVIPWVGFPLRDLVKRLQPTARAFSVACSEL